MYIKIEIYQRRSFIFPIIILNLFYKYIEHIPHLHVKD